MMFFDKGKLRGKGTNPQSPDNMPLSKNIIIRAGEGSSGSEEAMGSKLMYPALFDAVRVLHNSFGTSPAG